MQFRSPWVINIKWRLPWQGELCSLNCPTFLEIWILASYSINSGKKTPSKASETLKLITIETDEANLHSRVKKTLDKGGKFSSLKFKQRVQRIWVGKTQKNPKINKFLSCEIFIWISSSFKKTLSSCFQVDQNKNF